MRKRNISPERLIEAIKEYIDGKGSFDTIAEKYCIAYETIRNAYERYKENGISTFIETKHNAAYAEELKEKAVMEYLQGEGSQTAIAAKYGLRSKSQLQRCLTPGDRRSQPILRPAARHRGQNHICHHGARPPAQRIKTRKS